MVSSEVTIFNPVLHSKINMIERLIVFINEKEEYYLKGKNEDKSRNLDN